MKTTFNFSRRGPDYVSEELVSALSEETVYEFKPLFLLIHANLRARNAASGGEDMLRLRTYEKLQSLVNAGAVTKKGKEYQGVATELARLSAAVAEANAKLGVGRPTPQPGLKTVAPKLSAKTQGRKKVAKTPRLR